jgi:hypothetical protein
MILIKIRNTNSYKLFSILFIYSPVRQWSSLEAFGALNLGSNPSGAIFFISLIIKKTIKSK